MTPFHFWCCEEVAVHLSRSCKHFLSVQVKWVFHKADLDLLQPFFVCYQRFAILRQVKRVTIPGRLFHLHILNPEADEAAYWLLDLGLCFTRLYPFASINTIRCELDLPLHWKLWLSLWSSHVFPWLQLALFCTGLWCSSQTRLPHQVLQCECARYGQPELRLVQWHYNTCTSRYWVYDWKGTICFSSACLSGSLDAVLISGHKLCM